MVEYPTSNRPAKPKREVAPSAAEVAPPSPITLLDVLETPMQQEGIEQPVRGYEEVPVQGVGRSETGALSAASLESFREAWSGVGLATDPALETALQKIKFEKLLAAEMAQDEQAALDALPQQSR